ncbi:TBC1 domain family member 19 [Schistosoma japonicum]|nr:TBC1 domain family member 19 [Schistosoma japonicum]
MIRLHMYDHPILTEDILVHEVLNAVKCSRIEMNLLDEAMALVDDPDEVSRDKIDHVYKLLLESGRFQALKNWIFTQKPTILLQIKQDLANDHYLNKSCSCNYLKKAQMSWERKMLRSLNSMCNELGIKLARKRSKCHNEAILQNWGELSIFFNKQSIIKPVFGPKDLLDILTNIKHPHMRPTSRIVHKDCTSALITTWGLINLPLNVKNLLNLREFYYPLHPGNPQIGVDDCELSTFELSREQEAEDVLSLDSSERAQQFLRCGCPLSYRAPIWALCLNAKVVREDYLYYNQLKSFVAENEYMTDELICKEVQLTASNDDMHFVFCDYTYQILLPFTRDQAILSHFKSMLASPPRVTNKNSTESYVYPPSGVIPFHGFSMYMLPLCYLYDDPVPLYITFRQFYVRYFYKLHTISDENSGILCLCLLFEQLLQIREPEIFFHLKSFGAQPVRFAFKWLMRAFSGFLAPDQVLLLWDRILGFDSLEILAVLAVAIFAYRRTNLLQVKTNADVEAVLADLTPLRVIGLLQMVIFTD